MNGIDDFRFESHKLLVQLDAATTKMMMLVASKNVSGPKWQEATSDHKAAFDAWNSFLNSTSTSLTDQV